jgi:hypothetical protein
MAGCALVSGETVRRDGSIWYNKLNSYERYKSRDMRKTAKACTVHVLDSARASSLTEYSRHSHEPKKINEAAQKAGFIISSDDP